jgi:hypothetical protein
MVSSASAASEPSHGARIPPRQHAAQRCAQGDFGWSETRRISAEFGDYDSTAENAKIAKEYTFFVFSAFFAVQLDRLVRPKSQSRPSSAPFLAFSASWRFDELNPGSKTAASHPPSSIRDLLSSIHYQLSTIYYLQKKSPHPRPPAFRRVGDEWFG